MSEKTIIFKRYDEEVEVGHEIRDKYKQLTLK